MNKYIVWVLMLLLMSCQKSEPVRKNTLSSLALEEESIDRNKDIKVHQKEAEKAYKEYLASENAASNNRKHALQRLAEIQLDMTVSEPTRIDNKNQKNSIRLFKKRLKEFPKDKNNDTVLYQLANAYAITGESDKVIMTLERLVDEYSSSRHYVESMFRLGEHYLSKSAYIDAELALTSVIVEDRSLKYKNNALFKRAWSKYKQLRYDEAIQDYNQLLALYTGGASNNRSDQEFLNNIYKVYSACITYLGIESSLSSVKEWVPDDGARYFVYSNLAKFLLEQDRYIDGGDVYKMYLKNETTKNRNKVLVALSQLWLRYPGKEYSINELLSLESSYGPKSASFLLNKKATTQLANNLIYVSEYFHSLSQTTKDKSKQTRYFQNAQHAYVKLLDQYSLKEMHKYAYLYADLLQDNNQSDEAIKRYQQAFSLAVSKSDQSKITYALLSLANKMFFSKKMAKDEYVAINSTYMKSLSVSHIASYLESFSGYLYNNKQFSQAVSYIEENRNKLKNRMTDKLQFILASSYFEIGEYSSSEKTYKLIKNKKKHKDIDRRLALAIFKQAENLKNKYLYEASIKKYDQISEQKLDRVIDQKAQIDVSAIYLQLSDWNNAITRLVSMRKKYPASKFNKDITNKLSVAYLNNNNDKLAAKEFYKISQFTHDIKLKQSAIWQAAELYETGSDYWNSIKTYKQYIKQFDKPESLYVEAMNKLTELYTHVEQPRKRNFWHNKIIAFTKRQSSPSERMKYLASKATIAVAREDYRKFAGIKLTVPLKVSLTKKKKVLKKAISSLQRVNQYKMYDHVSESIYWMAETYYSFSKSLMNSERPKNLSDIEREQYDILLEDQAIPFEDQAIRYYLQNTQALRNGRYGEWVSKSLKRLANIYPSKYRRFEVTESHLNQFY